MTAAAIRLTGLSKRWGESAALAEVSLQVASGSFCVLLGPSGCGKTTCLRIVAGLEQPSAGRVEIGGRDVTNLPPAARGVAMVFQSYALFPHLSVRENILFGLRARGVARAEQERRLAMAAEMLGLAALLARKPAQLSGGQQQRVALGRAIVAEAPVCLMDEPLSNLDAKLRAEMRHEIRALQRRLGITMLYVTHDQTEAMAMADQVVLLRGGRIEQDAPPALLYTRPQTEFCAGFIGQPPMNLLPLDADGRIAGTDFTLPGAAGAAQLGLRPEALLPDAQGMPARIEHVEFLGAESVLACRLGPHRLLVRLPGQVQHGIGDVIALRATEQHLFDAAGRRMDAPVLVAA